MSGDLKGPDLVAATAVPLRRPIRVRYDNDGCLILINPQSGTWLCATSHALQVLTLCDGHRSVAEVARAYGEGFSKADPEKVLYDVTQVLTMAKHVGFVSLAEE